VVKKRYTRKQLKQPDEFITASMKAWEWVGQRIKGAIATVVVVLLVVGAVSLWRQRANRHAKVATEALGRGLEIYNQTVFPGADKLPKREDGLPRFSTRKAKLEAAIKAFSKVIAAHQGGGVVYLAQLMRAGTYYDLGQYDKAGKDYEAYLSKVGTSQPRFRRTALEGLAYSYEARKAWDQALSTLAKLEKKGEQRFDALYHEGRVLAAKGDKTAAINRFKEIVDKATSRALVDQAGQRLAALNSK